MIALPSRSAIDRSGAKLSGLFFRDEQLMTPEEIEQAIQVVTDFRSAHAYPMQKVRYGLRSMVRTEGVTELISQRLKRVPRIVRKLHRMGNSRLSSLEDIGGCRAVLADGNELERLRHRVVSNWKTAITRERDYIARPKPMGYRAYHATVARDGRWIEVQLRTRGQQQWAEAVEAADARHGLNLKDGEGPESMVRYFEVSADVIHRREYDLAIDQTTLDEFDDARRRVIAEGFYRG